MDKAKINLECDHDKAKSQCMKYVQMYKKCTKMQETYFAYFL